MEHEKKMKEQSIEEKKKREEQQSKEQQTEERQQTNQQREASLKTDKDGHFQDLDAKALFERTFNQPLNTKKNILDYIDVIKKLSKEGLLEGQLQETYLFIEEHIGQMAKTVKPNTIIYLKNELKAKLGKYSGMNVGRENTFLRFFKETYENTKKTKEYTWVLADLNRAREQQILDTLKTINTYCFKNKLTQGEKKDILPMLQRIVDTQNIRYINQIKSMEGIRKVFYIKIIEENGQYKIIKGKK